MPQNRDRPHPVEQPEILPVLQPSLQAVPQVLWFDSAPTHPKLESAISNTDERAKPRGVMRIIVDPCLRQFAAR